MFILILGMIVEFFRLSFLTIGKMRLALLLFFWNVVPALAMDQLKGKNNYHIKDKIWGKDEVAKVRFYVTVGS